jgi:hypothetical protein
MAPPSRPAAPAWPGYLLALALAVGLHAWWWFESARPWQPDLRPRVPRAAPRLSYLVPKADAPRGDARDAWSPVLFALPSPAGFSPPADRPALMPGTMLRAGSGESVLLDDRAPMRAGPLDFLPTLRETVAAGSNELDFAADDPAFARAGPTTGFALRVQWVDGPPRLQGPGVNARDLAPYLDQRPWQVTAALQFDAFGAVRSVFLEEPTPSRERNEAVVRVLRRLRVAPGDEASPLARVQLQYDQGGQPAAPEAAP